VGMRVAGELCLPVRAALGAGLLVLRCGPLSPLLCFCGPRRLGEVKGGLEVRGERGGTGTGGRRRHGGQLRRFLSVSSVSTRFWSMLPQCARVGPSFGVCMCVSGFVFSPSCS
jgi:hypothetical protein